MEIKVEDASLRLLDELCEIEELCFKEEAFSKQQISYLLTDYNCISLVARVDNKIAGFIIGAIEMQRSFLVGHILTLDVAPAYSRRGAAQKLLQMIETLFKQKGAEECRLEVREDNVAALSLYKKLGYKVVVKLEHYYPTAHGLYLKKSLQ